jgi:cytosine/adenosine deaminase-related metal-dependent hydrolase
VLSPSRSPNSGGLVNVHTHLELGVLAHHCPPEGGAPFVPWILKLVKERQAILDRQGPGPFRAAAEAGIDAMRAAGISTVGEIATTGETVVPLLESGLSGVAYYEVIGLWREQALAALEQAKRRIEAWRAREGAMRVGLTVHAPYSCHPDLFREGVRWCLSEDVPLCVHAAESPAETELLANGTGDFLQLARAFGAPDLDPPGLSPIAYLEELGVLEARPLLVHCVEVSDEDVNRIARSGSSVAHCPRSNARLRCRRMPLEKFLAAGVPVALGTDSLSSSPSLDVREEAEEAIRLHAGRVPAEAVRAMLTAQHLLAPIS